MLTHHPIILISLFQNSQVLIEVIIITIKKKQSMLDFFYKYVINTIIIKFHGKNSRSRIFGCGRPLYLVYSLSISPNPL